MDYGMQIAIGCVVWLAQRCTATMPLECSGGIQPSALIPARPRWSFVWGSGEQAVGAETATANSKLTKAALHKEEHQISRVISIYTHIERPTRITLFSNINFGDRSSEREYRGSLATRGLA